MNPVIPWVEYVVASGGGNHLHSVQEEDRRRVRLLEEEAEARFLEEEESLDAASLLALCESDTISIASYRCGDFYRGVISGNAEYLVGSYFHSRTNTTLVGRWWEFEFRGYFVPGDVGVVLEKRGKDGMDALVRIVNEEGAGECERFELSDGDEETCDDDDDGDFDETFEFERAASAGVEVVKYDIKKPRSILQIDRWCDGRPKFHPLVPLHHYEVGTPLLHACMLDRDRIEDSLHLVRVLEDMDVAFSSDDPDFDEDGEPESLILMLAAEQPGPLFERLLQVGSIDPNDVDFSIDRAGQTVLGFLISECQVERAEMLLRHPKIDVHAASCSRSPMQVCYSVLDRDPENVRRLMQVLFDLGADILDLKYLLLVDATKAENSENPKRRSWGRSQRYERYASLPRMEDMKELRELVEIVENGWTPETHLRFPSYFRRVVWSLILVSERGTYLPMEIVVVIMSFLPVFLHPED